MSKTTQRQPRETRYQFLGLDNNLPQTRKSNQPNQHLPVPLLSPARPKGKMSKWIFCGCELESHHLPLQKEEETPFLVQLKATLADQESPREGPLLSSLLEHRRQQCLQGARPRGRSCNAVILLGPNGQGAHLDKEKERPGGALLPPRVRAGRAL